MIREERDPYFWKAVASHPDVLPFLFGATPENVADVATNPNCIPLASEHGGYLFTRIDGMGRVLELHSLFTPEGWGRETNRAGKAALEWVFADACMVVTYEVAGHRLSQPPKSFGFVPIEGFREGPFETVRTWILTREAWEASPARKRMEG